MNIPRSRILVYSIVGLTLLGLLWAAGRVGLKEAASPTPFGSAAVDTETPKPSPTEPKPWPTPVIPTVAIARTPTLTAAPRPQIITYTVQPGDTLWAISKRYGVSLEAIMKANELKDSEFILVGQELVIPLVTPVVSPSPTLTPSTQPVQATKVPIPTSPPVEAELIRHGDRSNPLIALTFDACQREGEVTGYDVAIIRILTETQTAATLFLGGLWMQSHPEETKLLADVPFFELGNHSWSHKDFSAIPVEVMMEEITRTQEIMYQLTGQQPTLFRFPYGTYTDEALRVVAQLGLKAIQWDVVTGDPDPKVSAEDIIREVMAKAQNGSIVIMHMNARGWHTAEALPTLIEKLSEKGFKFVTVSQLLEE